MGFVALLAILGVSTFAIEKGAWWVAGIALSVVTGTAAVFVLGTLKKRDEKQQGERTRADRSSGRRSPEPSIRRPV